MTPSHPVLGPLRDHWTTTALSSPFRQFSTRHYHGLAHVSGSHLSILALSSRKPGKHRFPPFLQELKRHYTTITFLAVWNHEFLQHLVSRHGFTPDPDGNARWTSRHATPPLPR